MFWTQEAARPISTCKPQPSEFLIALLISALRSSVLAWFHS
jgi:hypothetical protein